MIRRFQTWLFVLLLVASVAMGVVLWQLRELAHKRMRFAAPGHGSDPGA